MPGEGRDLIPRLALSNQDRDERMTQGVVSVQRLIFRSVNELLQQSIRPVIPALLNRPLALAFPTLVAPGVVELIEDRKQHTRPIRQLLDVIGDLVRDGISKLYSCASVTSIDRGIPTKTGKSRKWTHQAVARILGRML